MDIKQKRLEIFDASGETGHTHLQTLMVEKLKEWGLNKIPSLDVKFVNKQYLQKEDRYCQTYIYWYIYQRVLVGEPWYRVVQTLQQATPMQRFQTMTNFWHYLTKSGGGCGGGGTLNENNRHNRPPLVIHNRF